MIKTETGSQRSEVRNKKPEKYLVFLLLFTIHCSLFTVFSGCASPKGPVVLTPLPTPLPGYAVLEQKIVFSNNDIRISIAPLNSSEAKKILASKDANNPLAEALTQPKHLAFLLDIENFSKAKIIYNPVLTTLFDNELGIHKPLDYTDLYTLAGGSPSPEAVINAIKDVIYDLAVTIGPNQHTSRLLIFSGIEEETSEVAITMKEIYIGTSTIAASFGFKVSEKTEIKP